MFEYDLCKRKYQELGKIEVEKARSAYKKQTMYQLKKEAEAELKNQIAKRLEDNLGKLKKQFIQESRNGLMNAKALVLQQREAEKNSKSQQDQMLELLKWQQDVMILQAKANTLPPELLVEELAQVTDPKLFEVFKGAILSKCDEEQAMQVRNMKYVDKEMESIESSIKDCNFQDFKQGYVLPLGMDDRPIEDLVFDEKMSDFFFGGDGKEVGVK